MGGGVPPSSNDRGYPARKDGVPSPCQEGWNTAPHPPLGRMGLPPIRTILYCEHEKSVYFFDFLHKVEDHTLGLGSFISIIVFGENHTRFTALFRNPICQTFDNDKKCKSLDKEVSDGLVKKVSKWGST